MTRKWMLAAALPLLFTVIFALVWGYQYRTHSTPAKAQKRYDSRVGPFQTIPFASGVVLLTPGEQGSLTAWYMKKGFWGWKNVMLSSAVLSLGADNYNVDFESFAMDGQTFVWGTSMAPMKKIVYQHGSKTYTCDVGKSLAWHMILPFEQSVFYHSEWTMVLPNGKTAPLFKS